MGNRIEAGGAERNHFRVQKRFAFDDFDNARKYLYVATGKYGMREIVLDFTRAELLLPNGIVPLVALAEAYRTRGVRFSVLVPRDTRLRRMAAIEGWFHFFDPDSFAATTYSGYNTSPLMRFSNDDELNECVNRSIEIAMRGVQFAPGVVAAFEWSLNELAGNILHHSKAAHGYMQVNTFSGSSTLSIIVADSGIGIPSSMRARFTDLPNDRVAVEQSVQKGVTSKPDYGQGNGLAGTLAIAHEAGGLFSLISGGGQIKSDNQTVLLRDFVPPLQGTVAELRLPTNRSVDLPKALWGHNPADYIETHYENEVGDFSVSMKEVAPTFGNRPTGEKVRTLLRNLMVTNANARLVIDFSGVEIIASSFADEAFAKLFVEMGPLDYGARVGFSGMNGVIKGIINKAITERVLQQA